MSTFRNNRSPRRRSPTLPLPVTSSHFSFVRTDWKLPPEILPYFRSVTEMSEEVLGAIKFQHQNLLNLVDYLRENLAVRTTVVQQARDELEKRKQDQECPLPPVPLSLYPWQQRPY